MNIFYLHEDPETAAKWHCDRHITKMTVEYAQILSTAAWKGDFHAPERMYKPVPDLNPKVHDWAAYSEDHYIWLLKLARAVAEEYEHRYGQVHSSYRDVIRKIDLTEIDLPSLGFDEPPQCMPDVYQVAGDTVQAYRNFYNYGKKWELSWYNRDAPPWFVREEKEWTAVEQEVTE